MPRPTQRRLGSASDGYGRALTAPGAPDGGGKAWSPPRAPPIRWGGQGVEPAPCPPYPMGGARRGARPVPPICRELLELLELLRSEE